MEGASPPEQLGKTAAGSRAEAMRQAIPALMARSKREIPHYCLSTTVDMTNATAIYPPQVALVGFGKVVEPSR